MVRVNPHLEVREREGHLSAVKVVLGFACTECEFVRKVGNESGKWENMCPGSGNGRMDMSGKWENICPGSGKCGREAGTDVWMCPRSGNGCVRQVGKYDCVGKMGNGTVAGKWENMCGNMWNVSANWGNMSPESGNTCVVR